jgi:acetyl-CoA carboxylase carboxyltransferase component
VSESILLDPGTFNEIEPFITTRTMRLACSPRSSYGDGVITGYGQIDGRTVYVYAQDFTIYGGTLSEMQSHKICRVMDLALRNGVPFIGLIDSGGARIQEGVRAWAATPRSSGAMRSTRASSRRSASCSDPARAARPTPRPAGPGHHGREASFMFLTGPEVIKAVTGEVIDAESLGGADVHMSVSGVAHLAPGPNRKRWKLRVRRIFRIAIQQR